MEERIVSRPWFVVVAPVAAAALARLRLVRGLRVRPGSAEVGVQGERFDADLERLLRSIPAVERYWVSPEGELTPWGALLPVAMLPTDGWMPLTEWCTVCFPPPASPGRLGQRARLMLDRDSLERPAGGLLIPWSIFQEYADSAPLVRLGELSFAAADDGRALVRGARLPPLCGERFWVQDEIFVPLGFNWTPRVAPRIVREVLGLAAGEAALWRDAENWSRVEASAWVSASRSAVRASSAVGGAHG